MSYGIHWQSSAVSKNGNTYLLSIYENGYSSGIATIEPSDRPFVLNTLPSSDDPFAPLVATELKCNLNISDLTTAFIDFTTEDQYLYFATLEFSNDSGSGLIFQGWLMPDATRQHFSTGYKDVQFSFIDGIAFLKTIYYIPTDRNINSYESCLSIILNCLNTLNYINGFFLNVCVSIFAAGMSNRTASTDNEPLSQSFMAVRTWLNESSYVTSSLDPVYNSDYISCYDIISKLMLAWGCRLQQSNGQWHIININEMASADMYVTKYDQAGTLITSGHYNTQYDLVPWTLGTTKLHFTNNSQYKILRQGFPKIVNDYPIKSVVSILDNGFLRRITSGNPDNWNIQRENTHCSFTLDSFDGYFEDCLLHDDSSGNLFWIYMQPTTLPVIYQETMSGGANYDTISLNFDYMGETGSPGTGPLALIRLFIYHVSGAYFYYIHKDGTWHLYDPATGADLTGGGLHYYQLPVNDGLGELQSFSFTTPVMPSNLFVTGQYYQIYFDVLLNTNGGNRQTTGGVTIDGYAFNPFTSGDTTGSACRFSKIIMSLRHGSFTKRVLSSNNSYSPANLNNTTVSIEIGGNTTDKLSVPLYGNLTDSSKTRLIGWYRQGVTESKPSLMDIINQNYFNIISKASLNFDCDLMSLMSSKYTETSLTHFQSFASIIVQDNPSDSLSANGKVYIPCNMQIDLISDEIQQATLLETSNTDLTPTVTDLYLKN